MTWEIFLGIVALVGFALTVGAPAIKLNTSIIKLSSTIDALKDAMVRMEHENIEAHKRLWEHNESQDLKIETTMKRIDILEDKFKIAETLHPGLTQRGEMM